MALTGYASDLIHSVRDPNYTHTIHKLYIVLTDPKTHALYLPTANFFPEPASASKGSRPKMVKDSFVVLVVGK